MLNSKIISTDSALHEEHLHLVDREHRRGGGDREESGGRERASRLTKFQSFQHHQKGCKGKATFVTHFIKFNFKMTHSLFHVSSIHVVMQLEKPLNVVLFGLIESDNINLMTSWVVCFCLFMLNMWV